MTNYGFQHTVILLTAYCQQNKATDCNSIYNRLLTKVCNAFYTALVDNGFVIRLTSLRRIEETSEEV